MGEIFTVTKRDLIKQVAERWKRQYPYSASKNSKDEFREIYLQLLKLPADATEDQVTAIIGNNTWMQERCDECGKEVEGVAVLGDRNGDCRARICLDCLKNAVNSLESHFLMEKLK